MAASFRATTSQVAIGVTAYAIAYAVGAPLLAPLGDRYRAQIVATAGILVFSAATVAASMQNTLVGLYAARIFAGIGGAVSTPNVQAYVTRRYSPALRAKLIGIIMAGLSFSIVLGVPVGSFAASMLSWRTTFQGVALMGAIAALLLIAGAGSDRYGQAPGMRRMSDYGTTLASTGVRHALGATLLWMTGFYGLYTYLSPFLQQRLGIGVAATGFYLIAYGAGNLLASLSSGWVSARIGTASRTILVMGIVSGIFVILLTAMPLNPTLAVVFLIGWAIAQGYGATALVMLAASQSRHHAAIVLALNSSFIYVGVALGSALFGLFQGPAIVALGIPSVALTIGAAINARTTPRQEETHPHPDKHVENLPRAATLKR